MRYSFISAAILALVSSAFAQDATDGFDIITSPTDGQKVPAGKPFDIVWQPGTKPEYLNGTATIVLLQGKTAKDLQIGDTIVAGVKNSLGKYTWNVPTAATFETYGLRITLDDDKSTTQNEASIFQYSFPFQIASSGSTTPGTTTVILGTGTNYTPTPTPTPSLSANTTTLITTSASAVPTNSANFTLTTSTSTRTTSRASTSSTSPAGQTANAAVANVVSGGIALVGGVMMAFAL